MRFDIPSKPVDSEIVLSNSSVGRSQNVPFYSNPLILDCCFLLHTHLLIVLLESLG